MYGDFNNVGNFGCKFVNGAVNGPGTYSTNNQWYTMSMGLGTNYNFWSWFFGQIFGGGGIRWG